MNLLQLSGGTFRGEGGQFRFNKESTFQFSRPHLEGGQGFHIGSLSDIYKYKNHKD